MTSIKTCVENILANDFIHVLPDLNRKKSFFETCDEVAKTTQNRSLAQKYILHRNDAEARANWYACQKWSEGVQEDVKTAYSMNQGYSTLNSVEVPKSCTIHLGDSASFRKFVESQNNYKCRTGSMNGCDLCQRSASDVDIAVQDVIDTDLRLPERLRRLPNLQLNELVQLAQAKVGRNCITEEHVNRLRAALERCKTDPTACRYISSVSGWENYIMIGIVLLLVSFLYSSYADSGVTPQDIRSDKNRMLQKLKTRRF